MVNVSCSASSLFQSTRISHLSTLKCAFALWNAKPIYPFLLINNTKYFHPFFEVFIYSEFLKADWKVFRKNYQEQISLWPSFLLFNRCKHFHHPASCSSLNILGLLILLSHGQQSQRQWAWNRQQSAEELHRLFAKETAQNLQSAPHCY